MRVVLVGDSHAAQWLPALKRISEARSWSLTTMLRTGCPLNRTYTTRAQENSGACIKWVSAVLDRLQTEDYTLMVTSAFSGTGYASADGTDGVAAGFASAWSEARRSGTRVAAIRDTPIPEKAGIGDVPSCLLANSTQAQACDVSESHALLPDPQIEAAAQSPSVGIIDMTSAFCRSNECFAAIGGVLVYRDGNHITRTFAESASRPALRETP